MISLLHVTFATSQHDLDVGHETETQDVEHVFCPLVRETCQT